jgi:hypothetical protein
VEPGYIDQHTPGTKPITKTNFSLMDVHHHPDLHHKKKKFKEYFLEFIMIFLAVALGFFSENLRERIADSNREQQFARQLYIELSDDSATVANKITLRLDKESEIDHLSAYFKDSSLTELPKFFFPAVTKDLFLLNSYTFEPKDGILTQLRNSGAILNFRNMELQRLLGNLSVSISNIRNRNEQEYQYFSSPIKPFLLEHFDWSWYNELRNRGKDSSSLTVINRYMKSDEFYPAKILHIETLDRIGAKSNLLFWKQMFVSTRTLQLNNYITLNRAILALLRKTYALENQ